jgi:hypothetical protein
MVRSYSDASFSALIEIALFGVHIWAGVPPPSLLQLRTERDPVFETLCSIRNNREWTYPGDPVIKCNVPSPEHFGTDRKLHVLSWKKGSLIYVCVRACMCERHYFLLSVFLSCFFFFVNNLVYILILSKTNWNILYQFKHISWAAP